MVDTVSGYAGGRTKNPDYKSVSAGGTGHLEVVKVTFDPEVVSYRQLVDYFWRTVNPTDAGGQFCDRGESYQTAIFAQDEAQKKAAEESKAALEASKVLKWPVVTPVRVETQFWPAEDYHQNYYQVNSLKYKYYRYGCGRDARLKELWGDTAGKFAGS
ncbi:peptide-methionine (S)-S-oxide reductase MsrA [Aerophototrophica crusticola]|uniref:peptide-methionine (S)-S-oxide reductase MsrA n=1 Tax=Aerophototrophica crusticola TaxID=1709002 RepID=UPI00384C97BB